MTGFTEAELDQIDRDLDAASQTRAARSWWHALNTSGRKRDRNREPTQAEISRFIKGTDVNVQQPKMRKDT